MSRKSMRRAASVVTATALLAGGLLVGAGAATAAGASDLLGGGFSAAAAEQKPHAATKTTSNISVTKQVVGNGKVAPGQKVTYRTTFTVPSGLDRYITKIKDVHPAGFQYVEGSATINAWHLIGGQKTEGVTPEVNIEGNYVQVGNPGGWLISTTGSKTVTFEATYLVPANAQIGAALDSGLGFDVQFFATSQGWDPMGVFATIRTPNLGEGAATGSAGLGLGSSDGEGGTTGSAGSAIIEDPAGFVADVISGVVANGS
jgi:fimbrial isopeptide formation D2 family protein